MLPNVAIVDQSFFFELKHARSRFPHFHFPPAFEYVFIQALEILNTVQWSLPFLSEHIVLILKH